MRTLSVIIAYVVMATSISMIYPNALAAEESPERAESLFEKGRQLAENREWSSAKDILIESYDYKQKSITAYLLAVSSYHLDHVHDVRIYAEKSLNLFPKLEPKYESYAKKYLRWAEAKVLTVDRSSSFVFSHNQESPKDLSLLAAIDEKRKELKALESELGKQEAIEDTKPSLFDLWR